MFKLKACPRCQGDLIVNYDKNIWSEVCLQCGYERETSHPRIINKLEKKGCLPALG